MLSLRVKSWWQVGSRICKAEEPVGEALPGRREPATHHGEALSVRGTSLSGALSDIKGLEEGTNSPFFFSFLFFFFFGFLGPHPRHMEVPKLGVESEL